MKLFLGLVFAAGLGVPSAIASLSCPAVLTAPEPQFTAPSGWQTIWDGNAPRPLIGVTVFDGQPSEQASLVPDLETSAGGKLRQQWNFSDMLEHGERAWITCRYQNIGAELAQELPADIRSCVLEAGFSTGQITTPVTVICQ